MPPSPDLADRLADAVDATGHRPERLPSGAGHDAVAHLSPQHRSVLGEMTPQVAQAIKQWLMESLKQ